MLTSDCVLSQIFCCFCCSKEFVLEDRIDLHWIGPLHDTSIQFEVICFSSIGRLLSYPWSWLIKTSWNSGFFILCCFLFFSLENGFGFWKKVSSFYVFPLPPPKKKKTNYDVTSCPSMCRSLPTKNITPGFNHFQTWLRLGTKNLELLGEPVLQPHAEVGTKTQPKGDVGILVLQWSYMTDLKKRGKTTGVVQLVCFFSLVTGMCLY